MQKSNNNKNNDNKFNTGNSNSNSNKSLARIYAFQFLYHLQYRKAFPSQEIINSQDQAKRARYIEDYLNYFNQTFENKNDIPSEGKLDFARKMIDGVVENYTALEDIISKHSGKWTIEKISPLDLTILLLATYELTFYHQTPVRVVIDEAIELAKKFADKSSYAFINGVLDSIAKTLSREI
ncbi:MAG: transcription antitermination factor NusB [Oligoflexia bacterium]|nr:transcription antitermination factor NusB [Oligoflexia bacterium]